MKIYYPAAIHKDADSDYGVSFPDVPGCISAGSSYREAMTQAAEALAFHFSGMAEDGEELPMPTTVERWVEDPDFTEATWVLVALDAAALDEAAALQVSGWRLETAA